MLLVSSLKPRAQQIFSSLHFWILDSGFFQSSVDTNVGEISDSI